MDPKAGMSWWNAEELAQQAYTLARLAELSWPFRAFPEKAGFDSGCGGIFKERHP
jgi:hypothetical protein